MTPPAATVPSTARRAPGTPGTMRSRRPAAPAGRRTAAMPRGARRVSGPRSGVGAMRVSGAPAIVGAGVLHAPLGLRLARRAAGVPDARFLDRLIRGRVWIALIGGMLIGLVFLQLSLLSLNAGIGASMESSGILERQNAALRTQNSTMDADQRVQDIAAADGLVMPSAGARHYLKAGATSAALAAKRITAPKAALSTGAASPADTSPAAAVATADAAPAVSAAAVTSAVTTATPVTSTAAPVTTAPATAVAGVPATGPGTTTPRG